MSEPRRDGTGRRALLVGLLVLVATVLLLWWLAEPHRTVQVSDADPLLASQPPPAPGVDGGPVQADRSEEERSWVTPPSLETPPSDSTGLAFRNAPRGIDEAIIGAGDPPEQLGERLVGRVVDEVTGQPVTRFDVRVRQEGPAPFDRTLRVRSEDGAFGAEGLQFGTVRVAVRSSVHGQVEVPDVALPQTAELVVRLPPPPLSGLVVDESGAPVVHATVRLEQVSDDEVRPAQRLGRSDAEGRFVFGDLLPGAYRLILPSGDERPDVTETIDLREGERIQRRLVQPQGR